MKESLFIVFGLVIGLVLLRTYLFLPPQKKQQGFRKRYEARKKERNA